MLFQVSMRRVRNLHSLLRKYDINNTKHRKLLFLPTNRSCDNLQMCEYIFGTSKNSSLTFVDLSRSRIRLYLKQGVQCPHYQSLSRIIYGTIYACDSANCFRHTIASTGWNSDSNFHRAQLKLGGRVWRIILLRLKVNNRRWIAAADWAIQQFRCSRGQLWKPERWNI